MKKPRCKPEFYLHKLKLEGNIESYSKNDLIKLLIELYKLDPEMARVTVGCACLAWKYDGIKLREI